MLFNGQGFIISLIQSWLLALVLVSAGFFVIALMWRRRKTTYAVTKGMYGNWHTAIPRYKRSLHRLTGELERARRYGNALTLAVLSVDQEQLKQKKRNLLAVTENAEIASYFFYSLISSLLRDNLRVMDMAAISLCREARLPIAAATPAHVADATWRRSSKISSAKMPNARPSASVRPGM